MKQWNHEILSDGLQRLSEAGRFEAGRRRSKVVTLTTAILNRFHVDRKAKYRALRALEVAGLISVSRQPRKNPVVTILDERHGLEMGTVCHAGVVHLVAGAVL